MIRFEDLLEKVRAYTPEADVELLRRAYVFSAFEHKGQIRHSGEPYLIHPLAVADFLADMKLDAVAVEVEEDDVRGINTKAQLAEAESVAQQRLRKAALEAGAPDNVSVVVVRKPEAAKRERAR